MTEEDRLKRRVVILESKLAKINPLLESLVYIQEQRVKYAHDPSAMPTYYQHAQMLIDEITDLIKEFAYMRVR